MMCARNPREEKQFAYQSRCGIYLNLGAPVYLHAACVMRQLDRMIIENETAQGHMLHTANTLLISCAIYCRSKMASAQPMRVQFA